MNVRHETHEEHSPLEASIPPPVKALSQEWDKSSWGYMKEMWGSVGAGPHLSRVCLELSAQVSSMQEHEEICMQSESAQAVVEDKKNQRSSLVTFGLNTQNYGEWTGKSMQNNPETKQH